MCIRDRPCQQRADVLDLAAPARARDCHLEQHAAMADVAGVLFGGEEYVHDCHEAFRRGGCGLFAEGGGVLLGEFEQFCGLGAYDLGQHQRAHMCDYLAQEHLYVAALAHQLIDQRQCGGGVLAQQRACKLEHESATAGAQHLIDGGLIDAALGVADAHVEYAQRVAHAALGSQRDLFESLMSGGHALGLKHAGHVAHYDFGAYAVEVEALAA